MLPLLGRCLRLAPQFPPLVLNPTLHRPFLPLLTHQRHQLRFKGMVQKRKKRKGNAKPTESENAKRLRLKLKTQKELDKKRKRAEERVLARKTAFRLRPYEPRPDALPLGTALAVLRGWQAKAGIFVRSTAFRWAGETKVVALVRVARNSAQPRQLRGILQFPFPVVSVGGTAERGGRTEGAREKEKNNKKKRMMVILDEGENVEDAQKAGMMVGRRADLDDVRHCPSLVSLLDFCCLRFCGDSIIDGRSLKWSQKERYFLLINFSRRKRRWVGFVCMDAYWVQRA